MYQHPSCAPSSFPSSSPTPTFTDIECTGAQAGLSGTQQIRLMLLALVANNGMASMAVLYEAINQVIAPRRLSNMGKAALRSYMNRNCLQKGWVEADTKPRQAALWRLTPKGQALVAPVPRDRPRTFAAPMLRALGKLSGHTLNPVDRHEVVRATLREAGYDPNNLPVGWDTPSSNGQPQILEALRSLARSMSTLITRTMRNSWSLTPAGLERAAKYNGITLATIPTPPPEPVKKAGPNVTAQWFTKHLTPSKGESDSELMRMMRGALMRHMPLSVRRGLIEDHIQNFIVRVIHRDSFAQVLASGEEVPYSKVASYCVNSGRSDARDMGTDPVCREMMGARTDKERRMKIEEPSEVTVQPVTPTNPARYLDTNGSLMDMAEETTTVDPDQNFEMIWRRVEDVIQKRNPRAWEMYGQILHMKIAGFSTSEIAIQAKVTRTQASKMVQDARQMVRESCLGIEGFEF